MFMLVGSCTNLVCLRCKLTPVGIVYGRFAAFNNKVIALNFKMLPLLVYIFVNSTQVKISTVTKNRKSVLNGLEIVLKWKKVVHHTLKSWQNADFVCFRIWLGIFWEALYLRVSGMLHQLSLFKVQFDTNKRHVWKYCNIQQKNVCYQLWDVILTKCGFCVFQNLTGDILMSIVSSC